MRSIAMALSLCVMGGAAFAQTKSETMCQLFFPGASGCGGHAGVEANNSDDANRMTAWTFILTH